MTWIDQRPHCHITGGIEDDPALLRYHLEFMHGRPAEPADHDANARWHREHDHFPRVGLRP